MRNWLRLGLALSLGAVLAGCGDEGPTTPDPLMPALVDRVELVSAPEQGSTYLLREEVVFAVTLARGGTLESAGSVWMEFDLGPATQPAALRPISGDRLEFAYRLRRGDHDPDGISVPAGAIVLGPGARLTLDGEAVDLGMPALLPDPDHRVFAHYEKGETVLLDATFDLPEVTLNLDGAPGCADVEMMIPIAQAALAGQPNTAETLFAQGVTLGQCALLSAGTEAIFLSAEAHGDVLASWNLVLVYAEAGRGGTANWWTLGDFVNELEYVAWRP